MNLTTCTECVMPAVGWLAILDNDGDATGRSPACALHLWQAPALAIPVDMLDGIPEAER